MYSIQGSGGVAFKQHLLSKLVSVECCGKEQQFRSFLVLPCDDHFFSFFLLIRYFTQQPTGAHVIW